MAKIVYAIHRGIENELLLVSSTKRDWSEGRQSDFTPNEISNFLNQHEFPHGEVIEGVMEILNKDGTAPASEETEAGLAELMGESEIFEFDALFSEFTEECATP